MKKIQVVILVLVIIVLAVGIALFIKAGKVKDDGAGAVVPKPVSTVGSGKTERPGGRAGTGTSSGVGIRPGETHQQMLNRKLTGLNMSPAVRSLIGLNVDKTDREARRSALKKLTRTLSADDAQALSIFLDFRYEDNQELQSSTFEALKNDALVVLLNQKNVPEGLGSQLVTMFQDEKHSTRWRDYSLQYLSQYYEEASKPEDTVRSEITNAYAVALGARSQKYAGTALMAVERLSHDNLEFDRKSIGNTAVEIALADDTCTDSRITAMRVCGMMNRIDALPKARILAQTGETVPLRLAAIATVGDLGDKSDLEYIESLAASDDKRLQRISKTASDNLKERLSKAATSVPGG